VKRNFVNFTGKADSHQNTYETRTEFSASSLGTMTSSIFHVFTAVNVHIVAFWVETSCNLVGGYQRFIGTRSSSSETVRYLDYSTTASFQILSNS
jgi:hypothetical protein